MFSFDDNEIAWINENRALAKFVAHASALLIASYAVVDWFIDPGTVGWTLPLRLMGAASLVAAVRVLDNAKLRKWTPLVVAVTGAIVSVVVSIIFLVILQDFKIAIAAQMQVLTTLAVFATLRTAVRAMLPVLLLSFNFGLWWMGASWPVFVLSNWFLLGAFVTVLLVSEAAYKTFCIKRQLESERQHQVTIVQTSDDAIVGKTLDGIVTSWNAGAQKLFGYSAEEMLGQSLQILFPPERRSEEQSILAQIVKGIPVTHFETVRICKDGTRKDVSVSISPLRQADGTITGASKIARDISERKRIEHALHEKDTLFRTAIETTTDGFWAVDSAGQLLDANQAYARLSGYSRGELLAMRISDLDAADTPTDTAARMERIMRDGSASFETTHRRKDGTLWPVEVITSYSPINGGRYFVFTSDLTERKRAQEQSWQQANFDSLTGLPNRALLFDRLSKECTLARRNSTSVALLFADLDGFKRVNDSFGHDAGDLVLKEVARRWLACVREADTVARLGGDEFAIVLGGLQETSAVAGMADKLIAALAVEIVLPGAATCRVGASIGICMYPSQATEVDALISLADAAMYESKARGKNTYTFYAGHKSQRS